MTDDNLADNRLDVLVDCPGLTYVAAVALLPTSCVGRERVMGGELRSLADLRGPEDPRRDQRRLQPSRQRRYRGGGRDGAEGTDGGDLHAAGRIDLPRIRRRAGAGSGWDAEDGTIPDNKLDWVLAGPGGFSRPVNGLVVDFSPPATGFPLGDYTLT